MTSFRVPLGYDGVINYIVQNYAGQGFQEGRRSDLAHSIESTLREKLGNTEMQIGTLTQGGPDFAELANHFAVQSTGAVFRERLAQCELKMAGA